MRLTVLKDFSHAVGTARVGETIDVTSDVYGLGLIEQGLAEKASYQPPTPTPRVKLSSAGRRFPRVLSRGTGSWRIRAGRGLGDSVYLRPIVEYLTKATQRKLVVMSDYPGVFLGTGVPVLPFDRQHCHIVAHYTSLKASPNNQFVDMCHSARIPPLELKIAWSVKNDRLIQEVKAKAAGRKVVLVHGGRAPMGRSDGFGAELLPRREAFDLVLSQVADCFRVRVGNAAHLYPLDTEMDLKGRTSVTDLMDLASVCDAWVAQCSFAIPMAEAFDKPIMAVWSATGMQAERMFIRRVTPSKVFSKNSSSFIIDDWAEDKVKGAVDAFRHF